MRTRKRGRGVVLGIICEDKHSLLAMREKFLNMFNEKRIFSLILTPLKNIDIHVIAFKMQFLRINMKLITIKILYDRLTFPLQIHKTKFVFLNNRFNQAGNFFDKIIRMD